MAANKKVGTIQKPEPETFGIQCFYNLNVWVSDHDIYKLTHHSDMHILAGSKY